MGLSNGGTLAVIPSKPSPGVLFWVSFFVVLCGLYSAVYIHLLPVGPLPTDDLFYIDAAFKLQSGTYEAPTRGFPYHHYLRWPVILPLAALFFLFGVSEKTIGAYTLIYLMGISTATYFLILRLYGKHYLAAVASLAIVVVPAQMVTILVRSEPAALFWALVSLFLVAVPGRRFGRLKLLASGACFAFAVNATMIAVFSAPMVPIMLWYLRRRGANAKTLARSVGLFLLGLWLTYEAIMLLEWIFLGDYLIQYKAIKWWHLRPTDEVVSLSAYFDPDNRAYFVFGLLLNTLRSHPVLIALALLLLIARLATPLSRDRASAALLGMSLVSIITVELAGAFVVQKLYIRFLAIPFYLLCVYLLIQTTKLMQTRRLGLLGVSAVLLLLLGIHVQRNAGQYLTEDHVLHYYRDPIRLIKADIAEKDARSEVARVFFENNGLYGLIPWNWAVNCYSDYDLVGVEVLTSRVPSGNQEELTYFVSVSPPGQELIDAGFVKLAYPEPRVQLRPDVYVYWPGDRR
jgi:hypothetical protein